MPLVSVIVPLYNKERYALRALDSIAAQTLRDIEVIVVDDGSTDRGAAIAEQYPDPRFRVIRQRNGGPGAARNRGISEAGAELIAFLDADDEWLPDYLENATQHLLGPVAGIASFTSAYFNYPGGVSSEPMWRRRGITNGPYRVSPGMDPALLVYMLAFMSPCTTVARASLIRKWGGFYEQQCRFGEDGFLWLKVLLNEHVGFDLAPRVRLFNDASNLSKNLGRARPVEPFLEHPELIEESCPPEMQPLLEQVFTIRAFKTACVWGYWGKWREARALRDRYRTAGDWRLPFYWRSWVCCTPLGPRLASAWRMVSGQ